MPWERLARLLALLDQAEEGVHERGARQAQGPARAQRGARVAHEQPERVRGRVRNRAASRHQRGHRLQAALVPNKFLRMVLGRSGRQSAGEGGPVATTEAKTHWGCIYRGPQCEQPVTVWIPKRTQQTSSDAMPSCP